MDSGGQEPRNPSLNCLELHASIKRESHSADYPHLNIADNHKQHQTFGHHLKIESFDLKTTAVKLSTYLIDLLKPSKKLVLDPKFVPLTQVHLLNLPTATRSTNIYATHSTIKCPASLYPLPESNLRITPKRSSSLPTYVIFSFDSQNKKSKSIWYGNTYQTKTL
jgi:hypothetical protein